MVLEGATSPPIDSTPGNDPDPYSQSRNNVPIPNRNTPYNSRSPTQPPVSKISFPFAVNFDELGITNEARKALYTRDLTMRFQSMANMADRPLTPAEQQALARLRLDEVASTKSATTGSAIAIGVWLGLTSYAKTPKLLRVWTPETMNKKSFAGLFPAGSPRARLLWRISGVGIATFGLTMLSTFFTLPMLAVSATLRTKKDEALQVLWRDAEAQLERRRKTMGGGIGTSQARADNVARQQEGQTRREQMGSGFQSGNREDAYDDNSPTAGQERWQDAKLTNARDIASARAASEPKSDWSAQDSFQQSNGDYSGSDSRSAWDDASPAASAEQQTDNASGSSWDRLYRQAQAEKRGGKAGQQGQSSQGGSQGKSQGANDEKWW